MVLITLAIALISSLAWHIFLSRYSWVAHVASVATAIGLSSWLASSHMTKSDLVWIAVTSFLVSLIVGYGYRNLTSQTQKKSNKI